MTAEVTSRGGGKKNVVGVATIVSAYQAQEPREMSTMLQVSRDGGRWVRTVGGRGGGSRSRESVRVKV